MKGISFRRKAPSKNYARIIVNINESIWDKFIPLTEAMSLYATGKIKPVELGNAYPYSFEPTEG